MKHYLKVASVVAATAAIAVCGPVGSASAASVTPDFYLKAPTGLLTCTLAYASSVQHNPASAIPLYTYTAPAKLTFDANSRTYAYALNDTNASLTYAICVVI